VRRNSLTDLEVLIIDTDEPDVAQRLIAENPFTPFAEIEIRPLIDPAAALGILQEAYSNR
jgi:hypothetical protein